MVTTLASACSGFGTEPASPVAVAETAAARPGCVVPEVIGHRGTAADENTLKGLRDAVSAGAAGVEFDVWWTSDGVPVLSHDPTVDRTTTGHGAISSMTAAEVRLLRTKKGVPVPTLEEALRYVAEQRMTAMVELKPTPTPAQVQSLLAAIRDTRTAEHVVVHSFNRAAVDAVRQAAPELRTALTHDRTEISGVEAARYGTSLNVSRFLATPEAVEDWHASGLHVYVWTANRAPDWEKAKSAGVDAVLTDRVTAYMEWARAVCTPEATTRP
ncbi:glycerophosphodiester phosphodiesterase [Streptomyces sp. DSM 40712]|uniref:Glycerophosphodiester phosphodiesterase n=2 Tax=Streptomyces lancefieldiae TaxID=3075520 RepID=A0ABU3AVB5_9ACTN|nr:glycerophosphodiester phosphodiesterase [Streptomyces sp. DSM 40712]